MKLTLDKDRNLRDEAGKVVGTVVGFEIELASWSDEGPGEAVKDGQQLGLELPATDVGGRASASNSGKKFDPVPLVWDHYCEVHQPRNKGLDPQARAIIRDALRVATVTECNGAIDGCFASRFHMGDNDRRKKYNALSQILKGKRGGRTTREQIDFFLEIAEKSGRESGVPSVDNERVRAAKREVLDAWEFPADEHVARRGTEARTWLESVGWKIEQDESGRPTFEAPAHE